MTTVHITRQFAASDQWVRPRAVSPRSADKVQVCMGSSLRVARRTPLEILCAYESAGCRAGVTRILQQQASYSSSAAAQLGWTLI
jgi:hypothetical protein